MKLPAVAKRASWNLIDQMISSLTNAVLSFMVARAVDPVTFGGFAVAFTVFTLVIGGARAVCTAPLNIRFSDTEPDEQRRGAAAATGLSLVIAVVVGVGTVVAGLLLGGSTGEALLVMGLVLPAVIVQDSYRYVFFSRQTPVKAAVNDGVWAVLQISAVAVLLFAGVSAVGPFVLVWGVAGAAAVLLALRQSATLPDPRRALGWVREQNDLTRYTFASWATQQGTMQGALLVIATIGSVVANGALRGAQILLGPASIISSSALTFAIPEFARRKKTLTDRQWILAACGVSGVVAFLAFCWGAVFLLLPDSVGEYLLNDTWAGTRELLVAAVVGQVLACLTVGPVVMLYAIDRAKATFRIHLVLGTLVFLGGVGGVVVGGGPGAQWGFAIANGVVLPFWFVRLWRELRARTAAGPEPEESEESELQVGAVDAEATTVLSYRRKPQQHFFHDLESAQMATMVLPRITPAAGRPAASPRGVRPSPGPRPAPVPRPGPFPAAGRPGAVPPGYLPVPPGRVGPPPPGAPHPPGRPVGPVPPRPAVPRVPGVDVAPDQSTRTHVLPAPPPRPSPRPRPDLPAPADASATVVTPAPTRAAPPAVPAEAAPRPATPGAEQATTVQHVVGPDRDGPPGNRTPAADRAGAAPVKAASSADGRTGSTARGADGDGAGPRDGDGGTASPTRIIATGGARDSAAATASGAAGATTGAAGGAPDPAPSGGAAGSSTTGSSTGGNSTSGSSTSGRSAAGSSAAGSSAADGRPGRGRHSTVTQENPVPPARPDGARSDGDRAAAEPPVVAPADRGRPGAEGPPVADRPVAERADGDRPAPEAAGSDRPSAERPSAGPAGTGPVGVERVSLQRGAAVRPDPTPAGVGGPAAARPDPTRPPADRGAGADRRSADGQGPVRQDGTDRQHATGQDPVGQEPAGPGPDGPGPGGRVLDGQGTDRPQGERRDADRPAGDRPPAAGGDRTAVEATVRGDPAAAEGRPS